MTGFHPTSLLPDWLRPAVGLAAAVGAAMLLFSTGLAAMDRVQLAEQNRVTLRTGTFSPDRQSDYGVAETVRLPAQRPAR